MLGRLVTETRTVAHGILRTRQGTFVVEEHVEPEGHLVAIMFGSPVMGLLQ
jgi:hypothetical protein